MPILPVEPPLTPTQRLEALRIAHETKDPAVKRAAMELLCQAFVMCASNAETLLSMRYEPTKDFGR